MEIWRLVLDGVPQSNPPGAPRTAPLATVNASTNLVIDALGNVVAANPTDGDLAVVKLEGTTGLEIWTARLLSDFGQAFSATVDSGGDAVASGIGRSQKP